ncbi:MAG: DedD protein [Myxococcota bacterium]|jgi:DedD protein
MAHEMREFNRIKEKVVIRLDGRQVAWLVLGCVVIAGGVFAAGYQIGNLSSGSSLPAATALMAPIAEPVLDETTQTAPAADQVYTYDSALVQETAAVAANDPTRQVIVAHRLEILAKDARENGDMDLAGPRPADEKPYGRAVSAFANKHLPAGPAAGARGQLPADAPVEDAEGEEVGLSELEAAMDSGDDNAIEIAKANVPVRAPEPPAADVAPGALDGGKPVRGADGQAVARGKSGNWTIQIKAFRSRKDAKEFIGLLKEAGYKPYLVAARVPGKGRYFRVRLGKYASKDAATRQKRAFEKAEGFATIVTRL